MVAYELQPPAVNTFSEFKTAMIRRLQNRAGLHSEISGSNPVSKHHPLRLLLYMTRKCNARCIMCHGVQGGEFTLTEADQDDVSFQLFQEHMQPFLPYAERCDLYGLGEVLLMRPTVLKILSALQPHHLLSNLVTNGSLLTSRVVDDLAARGLSRLIVSVDAVEPKLYEEIRQGLKWPTLDRNLRCLFSRETFPNLEINMVVMRRNVQQIPRLLEYLRQIHSNTSRVTCSFYLLNIMKKDDFFRQEVFYPADAAFLQSAFEQAKELGRSCGYEIHTPSLDKLNEAELAFHRSPEPRGDSENQREGARPGAELLPICSRPWDTYFLLPKGRGKICCYNPIPVDDITGRNCPSLQRLRQAVNHPHQHGRYAPCRFCSERPASDFSKPGTPPLELNFPPLQLSGEAANVPWDNATALFPILHGAWSAGRLAGEDWLVAQRTPARFSDLQFRLNSPAPAFLQVEYLDEAFQEAGFYLVQNGAWKELGRITCENSGWVKSSSFPLHEENQPQPAPAARRDFYIIVETNKARLRLSKVFVAQKKWADESSAHTTVPYPPPFF